MQQIRPAVLTDIPRIHAIADQYLLSSLTPEQVARHGFLVSNFTHDQYRQKVAEADGFLVLTRGGNIEAFMLAYSDSLISPQDAVSFSLKSHHPGPFVLIKQVCVDLHGQRGGAGRALYQALSEQFPGQAQFAAVVTEPENTLSIRFHERLGFTRQYEMTGADGYRRGLWGRTQVAPQTPTQD